MDAEELYESALHIMAEGLAFPHAQHPKTQKCIMDGVRAASLLLYDERQKLERKLERFWAGFEV